MPYFSPQPTYMQIFTWFADGAIWNDSDRDNEEDEALVGFLHRIFKPE